MKTKKTSLFGCFIALGLLTGAGCDRSVALPSSIVMSSEKSLPQFTVDGTAKLNVAPDCADIHLTVTGEAVKSAAASANGKSKIERLRGALAQLGITNDDIKLSSATLSPHFEYDRHGIITNRRFVAETSIVVTTRDFEKVSDVMDAAADSGIGQMSVRFRKEGIEELKSKVRDMALQAAKNKARQMAKALDIELGAVVGITEHQPGYTANSYYANSVANADTATIKAAAMAPQEQELVLHVSISYQLPIRA